MRATEFLFECRRSLAATLAQADGRELLLEHPEGLAEGDWLMVTVRVPDDATCLAGRVVIHEGRAADGASAWGVEFAEHDWDRLVAFAAPQSGDGATPKSSQTAPCSICPPCDTNVLVVHDDPAVAELLRRMLANHGFCASWVSTLEEALIAVENLKVDLVLADWIPVPTAGQDFCAELDRHCRAQGRRRPPLVFLACPSARGDRARALQAGADDFVVLPFRWRELDARLLSLLHRAAS